MSSSAGLSKVSSSSQRHLPVAFFELTSLPERTSERLRTRLVETAPVEELDNFRFGAPIVAERLDDGEITRVNNKLIDAGDDCDQDWAWQTGGQGATGVTRPLGALTRTTCVCAACAFVGLEAAGAYARMRDDTPIFQELY